MPKHLLILEDESELSLALARRFERRGFRVTTTSTVEGAWPILQASGVDLVVSDIDLAGPETGVDLLTRCGEASVRLPFVFLSGHDEGSALMRHALAVGAAAVFNKPTDFSVLLQKVCELLGLAPESVALAGPK